MTELRRAQAAVQARAQRFEAHLATSLARAGFDAATSSDRFALSLDLMAGRKRLYQQEPRFYLFSGLPQIQFQPRETLPWLAAIEAATGEIRAELDGLLTEPEPFRLHVEPRADRPSTDDSGSHPAAPRADQYPADLPPAPDSPARQPLPGRQ